MKTVKEVAHIFNVSEITIRRWIADGTIKTSQLGFKKAIRISDEEIERIKQGNNYER